MFDTVTGEVKHLPRHATLPILMSSMAQAAAVGAFIVIPLMLVTDTIPEIPSMMAFVAAPPPPPPPPPPPAPAPKPVVQTATPMNAAAAPIEPPTTIAPERPSDEGLDIGAPGGVEGGIPGGVVGGVLGGLPEAPPPPPPPPAVAKGPVRIGGQIQTPALITRVEPAYPPIAVSAHLEGIVILEAIVSREGTVEEVKVLRSVHPLLDREAVTAVKQWRYSPLVLNGIKERFVLTVTLSFHLQQVS